MTPTPKRAIASRAIAAYLYARDIPLLSIEEDDRGWLWYSYNDTDGLASAHVSQYNAHAAQVDPRRYSNAFSLLAQKVREAKLTAAKASTNKENDHENHQRS